MATIMYPSLQKSQSMRTKRKSAVELLAESKAFYVKSETVRDSQQVLPLRLGGSCVHNSLTIRNKPGYMAPHQMVNNIPGWRPMSMSQYMAVSPSRSLPPLRVSGRRSTSACSDVLQNKLRKLLNSDSHENVSSSCSEERLLTDDFIPISPPAEYAITERSSYRYNGDRSSYRSPPNGSDQRAATHKSLPDLHNNPRGSQVISHGSNKSASNKSLSNRDSGESSGHYTHRSEPAPNSQQAQGLLQRPEVRRDSGSSTQHSGGSIYYEQMPSPVYPSRTTRQGYSQPAPEERYRVPPYDYTPATTPFQDPTLSPGPGTFKRQKCFRYKQRAGTLDRNDGSSRPILRSKSDISDRYWRCGTAPSLQLRHTETSNPPPNPTTAVSHLEQFFEQLGLNSESYEHIIVDGNRDSNSTSPVYFSDVSTVDSSRPIDNVDYCTPPPPFRPSDPPSIVERNARIIKWLCNCRKLQITNGNS